MSTLKVDTIKSDTTPTVTISDGLSVTGVTTSTGNISIADKIVHTGDTDTSIRFPDNDSFTVETAGSERIRIQADGDIGLGEAAPNKSGYGSPVVSIGYNTSNNYSVLELLGNKTSDASISSIVGYNVGGSSRVAAINFARAGANNSGAITFETYASGSSAERLRIGLNGEILTGGATSEPIYPAYITARKVQAEIKGAIDTVNTRHHGSLAINCTNENATLHLVRSQSNDSVNADAGVIGFTVYDGTDFHQCASIIASRDAAGGNNDTPGRLTFHTTGDGAASCTERVRLTCDGKLLVGATSSGTFSGDPVDHRFDQKTNNGYTMNITAANNEKRGLSIYYPAGGTADPAIGFRVDSAWKFILRGDGDCENANNSYGSISDVALKENIVDANSQWNDIKNIKIRNYNFKASTGQQTHTQIGVIAQELETVSPKLVKVSEDDMKTVSYSVLYLKAVKALQEAMAKIEVLETKVAALESA